MAKNYSRVQRGMVFWFNPDKAYKEQPDFEDYKGKVHKTSIQRGNRPWLVISNNEGNNTSYTCNVIPLTAETSKAAIPVHVHFDFEGVANTVLVEQIRTVDSAALTAYMCTLSDAVMEKVEKALTVQLAIRSSVTYMDMTLDKTIEYLKNLVEYILKEKQVLVEKQEAANNAVNPVIPVTEIEDTALQLGEIIEDLIGVSKSTQKPQTDDRPALLTPVPKDVPAHGSQIDKFNQRLSKAAAGKSSQQIRHEKQPRNAEKPPVEENTNQKRKRNSWTEESRRAYLADCDKLTPQEVMVKYNFKNVQSVFQTKYMHKNALGIE